MISQFYGRDPSELEAVIKEIQEFLRLSKKSFNFGLIEALVVSINHQFQSRHHQSLYFYARSFVKYINDYLIIVDDGLSLESFPYFCGMIFNLFESAIRESLEYYLDSLSKGDLTLNSRILLKWKNIFKE